MLRLALTSYKLDHGVVAVEVHGTSKLAIGLLVSGSVVEMLLIPSPLPSGISIPRALLTVVKEALLTRSDRSITSNELIRFLIYIYIYIYIHEIMNECHVLCCLNADFSWQR